MVKLPKRAGVSLNPQHYRDILDTHPDLSWLEVQPDFYLGLGGTAHFYLEKLAKAFPIGFNSSLLSIGSAESVNDTTLNDLKRLVEIYQPCTFTELLSWNRWQGTYLKTPQPLPYTDETFDQVCLNIKAVQNTLGRRILVENAAHMLPFAVNTITESEFFHELVRATGCGVCLNVSHLYISSHNFGRDPFRRLSDYPLAAVQQLRLSGITSVPLTNQQLVMTDYDAGDIGKPVWQLYRAILSEMPGPVATSVSFTSPKFRLDALTELAANANAAMAEVHPTATRGTKS